MNASCMSGTLLGCWEASVNEILKIPLSWNLYSKFRDSPDLLTLKIYIYRIGIHR
jgi:hypothetical protein